MNTPVPVLGEHVFISLGQISKSGTTGLYGKCMFNSIGKYQIVMASDYIILHSHQQHIRISVTSLLALSIVSVIHVRHFKGCVVGSHCDPW